MFEMPDRVSLGQANSFTLSHALLKHESDRSEYPHGNRFVMGFPVPDWQRGIVWDEDRQIKLIESIWRGIPIGTYTYNQTELDSPLDGLLIDGQQRMHSIQCYVENKFAVFGSLWFDISPRDKRVFSSTHFSAYVTGSKDEDYLRGYYDLMNFGGVSHSGETPASTA